jgi:hypothetical protein
MFPAFLTLAGCGASFLEGTIAPPNSSAWMKCGAATKVRVKPPHSTVTVAYTEPTTGTDGKPLTNLAHTTIYYNAGDGPVIGCRVFPVPRRPQLDQNNGVSASKGIPSRLTTCST